MNSKPMNPYHEFLRLVYKTRKAQKEFNLNHSKQDLRVMSDLEKQVDAWLQQAGFEAQKIKQQLSFLEGDKNEP